jgi:hypothetical protein
MNTRKGMEYAILWPGEFGHETMNCACCNAELPQHDDRTAKGKVTRRERFLAEMDAVIPWTRLLALIKPHYP